MKKMIALFLSGCLALMGCSMNREKSASTEMGKTELSTEESKTSKVTNLVFDGLDDPKLLSYYENAVYTELVDLLNSNDYFVENVSLQYISKEYLEEVNYNSQENIYFGYTLLDIEKQFKGSEYVFTVNEEGKTIVKPFEEYDDTFDKIIKNIAIGSGVILVCVTVSTLTGGVAPAVSMIFAASAKTGTAFALSSGFVSGSVAALATGIQTGDFDETVKAASLAASDAFKWGAITGVIASGATEAIALKGATLRGLTMNEAAIIQRKSKYPLDVIKEFRNLDQYNICKEAGLVPKMVNGKVALIRSIDLNIVDDMGRTNLIRMKEGLAPLDASGVPYELHHIGQEVDSTLAILTKVEHMQNGNNKIWHQLGKGTKTHGAGNNWDKQRQLFWKTYVSNLK